MYSCILEWGKKYKKWSQKILITVKGEVLWTIAISSKLQKAIMVGTCMSLFYYPIILNTNNRVILFIKMKSAQKREEIKRLKIVCTVMNYIIIKRQNAIPTNHHLQALASLGQEVSS